jgi:GNAT superfamily N-acetyltransferase
VLDQNLSIKQLSNTVKEDFYRIHRAGEYTDFCLCGYWWVPSSEGWSERTEKEAIAQREDLFTREISDGYLLYRDEEPVGWCQVYQRDLLPNLVNTFTFTPDVEVWCVGCFMIVPQARGMGLARRFFSMILVDLQDRGIKKVQAYPKLQSGLSANEVWTGPASLYQKAGFKMISEQADRAVFELDLPGGVLYE